MRGRDSLTPAELHAREYIANKIKELQKKHGYRQTDIVNGTGITQSTLSQYMTGKRLPFEENVKKLADFFDVPVHEIDPRFSVFTSIASTTLQSINETVEQLEESRRVIVLDTAKKQLDEQKRVQREVSDIIQLSSYRYYDHPASAGTGQYLTEVAVEQIQLPVEIDADFVIPIYGDSMEPDYHDGDYIFVKLSVDLASGDIGVFDYEGDAYVKQLIIEDGQAHLHSLNPTYPDKPITPETNFRIIGKVVGSYTAE